MVDHHKLKGGVVVRLRVNPTICLSILNFLDSVGGDMDKSFPAIVADYLALSTKVIEKVAHLDPPNGFDYTTRMSKYFPDSLTIEKAASFLLGNLTSTKENAIKQLESLEETRKERELTPEESKEYSFFERIVYEE